MSRSPVQRVLAGRLRRFAILLAIACVLAAGVTLVRSLALTFNVTSSMPIGLYHLSPAVRAPARGDLVEICLPSALALFAASRRYLPPGPCPHALAPLLKFVAAVPGDVVDVSGARVVVNGLALPGSRVLAADAAGRPLPHARAGRRRLTAGEVWLWTPCPRGWDSRYYGPLPAANVRALAQPFLVDPLHRPC